MMGYAVYEDATARDHGVDRWAGYGVPAVCDLATCEKEIDRGMAYRCEEYIVYGTDPDTDEETETEEAGCGLHFCPDHLEHGTGHDDSVKPKPDTAEWIAHQLTDDSWSDWRAENPQRVLALGG